MFQIEAVAIILIDLPFSQLIVCKMAENVHNFSEPKVMNSIQAKTANIHM